ncbi:hypothetical protein C9890_0454 [Perkinsus sp. BL_2016]|nr:hypothetical protein C9890_0454 [Perkinsus sp. BL_2016]
MSDLPFLQIRCRIVNAEGQDFSIIIIVQSVRRRGHDFSAPDTHAHVSTARVQNGTMKEQSKIIRESIVAISAAAGSSASKTTVTTRDACRAIRSFTGQPIPDLTSITRVPQQQVLESAVSAQVTPVIAPVELGSLSPSMRAVSDEGMPEVTKKRSNSLLAAQASLKVPKKRGRPRKHPLPENR